jgi:hypothetical protein
MRTIKSTEPPRYTTKEVAWHENGNGTLILKVGYCPDTLTYFLGLAQQVLKDVPEAKIEDAICGKVTKSDYCQGFTLMLVPVPGPKRKIKGYRPGRIDFNF